MMITNPQNTATAAKPKKRSVLGMLFNPQLGPAISPLRDSTRMFVQLIASVFAIYKVIPKDYPGLRDEKTNISLVNVMRTAWQNLRFTREGAPQAIIFFAVLGIIVIGGTVAVTTILSLMISNAHAAPVSASVFTPSSQQDLAQTWMDYLFNNPSSTALQPASVSYTDSTTTLGSVHTVMPDPFNGSQLLQKSLISMLALYSDAILIVAAIILFYHLAAMIVETAHHGVPMGKRASQIWAPIRLVVAIGLLVPINGGLSSGQFIVVKVAEMGSALASNAWDKFMDNIGSNNGRPIMPGTVNIINTGYDIIRMKACVNSWNHHVGVYSRTFSNFASLALTNPTIIINPLGQAVAGYAAVQGALADRGNVCGTMTLPSAGDNAYLNLAIQAQNDAFHSVEGKLDEAAAEISNVYDLDPGQSPHDINLRQSKAYSAVMAYQKAVTEKLSNALGNISSQSQDAINAMKPYGWVMAGAYLNSINRIQVGISHAVDGSKPIITPPEILAINGGENNSDTEIRKKVAQDLANFGVYQQKALTVTQSNTDLQCAAMAGLSSNDPYKWKEIVSVPVDLAFRIVDTVALITGVWSMGDNNSTCSTQNPGKTFSLGLQINGYDPFAALASFGQGSIRAAALITDTLIIAHIAAKVADVVESRSLVTKLEPVNVTGPVTAGIEKGIELISPFIYMFVYIFWIVGFLLGFMVPIMPFMRFAFAVLSWMVAVAEAVIAIPLVALAHLNPEGDGLPGQAKGAYFFMFNIFLRPILTVFGLICGLILFMIAVSFINFGFAVAVSGSGATIQGTAIVAKVLYTAIYVSMIYVSANHAFQFIDHLPKHALSWMGAQGQAMQEMGNVEKMEQLGTAAGYLVANQGQQAFQRSVGIRQGQKNEAKADRLRSQSEARQQSAETSGVQDGISGAAPNPQLMSNPNYARGYKSGSFMGSGGVGGGQGGGGSGGMPPGSIQAQSSGQSGSVPPGTNPTSGHQARMAARGITPPAPGKGSQKP